MLGGAGCWAGWGCCLTVQRVLSEVAAAVAVDFVVEVVAAVVQVDDGVVALHY